MEKLLDGVEVEWKTLGELGELVRGNGLQKKDFTETGVPAIHYGQIYTYYGLSTTETKSFVSTELAKKLRKVNTHDVVITNTSENLEDVGKALVYLGSEQAVTGGHATIFKPSKMIQSKYFAYFTQTTAFANEKRKYAKGTKVIDVSATDMAKIQIPIPCPENPEKSLAIQAEIVRILDTFTALTAELTAELTTELTARNKQYNYYCDQLLTFEEGEVEWKALGEVAEIGTGSSNRQDENENGLYPFYVRSKTVLKSNTFQFDETAIIVPGEGGIGDIFHYAQGKYALHQRAYRIHVLSENLNAKFLYHIMVGSFKQYILMKSVGATSISIRKPMLENFQIPIPPLDIQAEIVRILDTFTALTAELTTELTTELTARKKQYNYYRDQLLSFPKVDGEA